MNLAEWDQRYRSGGDAFITPVPLVVEMASQLAPGDALDLACGAGRNALYLASRGWRVLAVDGAAGAIETLEQRAAREGLHMEARVVDLEREFTIDPYSYDLICDCYYLQRSLFPAMKAGVKVGGIVISIVHLADPHEKHGTARRAYPGELRAFFDGWEILHYCEGQPRESCHKRAVAEIAARRVS